MGRRNGKQPPPATIFDSHLKFELLDEVLSYRLIRKARVDRSFHPG